MPDSDENAVAPGKGSYLGLYGVLAVYAAAFLFYAETKAFHWDEGYHLVAAQAILSGKKPYLDFCFPQSPLNAYWNALWMGLLGQNWRLAHLIAALLTIGAVVLMADFIARRFPVPSWRIAGAITAGLALGLNALVFSYGSVAQPYGMCLFTLAVAFRLTIRAVDRSGALLAAAAGLFAGAAAGSSLLSAAAAPVLLVWTLVYNRAGRRWAKSIAFTVGAAIPFAPVFWLFCQGPRATWFNVIQYHLLYRTLYWPDTTRHDLEVLTSWINNGQGLLLGLLALFGLLYVLRASEWPRPLKAEFYLCAWLAAALSALLGRAHPTFAQYFLLIVPFLAVLAVSGLYALSSRVLQPEQRRWPVLLVIALFVFTLSRTLYDNRDDDDWGAHERAAAQIDKVTPRNAPVFADELIYFLTRRVPPPGLELYYTHKLDLPAGERALLHILNLAEVQQQVQSGKFATAYSCDDDQIEEYGLDKLYGQKAELESCTVFWDLKK